MRLQEVRAGWFALGEDWAVFGSSKQEAIERYRQAEMQHREIEARPNPGVVIKPEKSTRAR